MGEGSEKVEKGSSSSVWVHCVGHRIWSDTVVMGQVGEGSASFTVQLEQSFIAHVRSSDRISCEMPLELD